ncbi:GTP-binding protein lepa [Rhizoclosmatium globosum]|uniref:GTP-binding protein lepa n=1 Tax=Rhizoclosmatium globosum TaxID=329046 RepID=A0A1Y2CE02_9FUNG|nr:GTP-binding protein lepa [Rhizoclosmatium globosum]|eukprot:ORY45288.1 GTP-binding protein lepa [Rhizoclosmatium globosum]
MAEFRKAPSISPESNDLISNFQNFTPDRIRNFSIIAHIDHGKSTLADRLLELTGTIAKLKRYLLKVEKERGITVKAQTASMFYTHPTTKETYLLNLIDTPGHVDFSYEVSRSLSACQGTLLLVDASQGIQAQTVANFFLAFSENLAVVPVLNKVDLPGADPEKVLSQIESTFELDTSEWGFQSLLFDIWYDSYVGVVCLIAVHSGTLKKGQRITSHYTKNTYEVTQLGIMHPEQTPTPCLTVGQVGFIHLGMKSTRDANIGDTFYASKSPNTPPPTPFPGFKPAKSMVFAGAVAVSRETSAALGQGFRLGFLGTLHMDVFRQRLEEEHDSTVINTAPTVSYQVQYKDERKNPAEFPEPDELGNVAAFYEPMVVGTLICPAEYVGGLMELCGSHRGEQLDYTAIDSTRVLLKYKLPMSEILTDFYDQLKSRTQGYATFDYEEVGYAESDLVKVNLLLNGKPVDALATIVHRSSSDRVAKEWVKRLKGVMDRQLMKLLEKQKAGKKRMKSVAGGIQLPQEAFLSLINGNEGGGSENKKK